ncbi:hypothetical protein BB561_006706, partial [Smittium simulii]
DTEAGTSCNWMGLELVYPELKTHINMCLKYEMEHTRQHSAMQSLGLLKKNLLKNAHSAETLLLKQLSICYLNVVDAQVATKPPLLPASISMRLVGKLLGGGLKLSSTRIRKDPTVLCVKTTLANIIFLALYATTWLILSGKVTLASQKMIYRFNTFLNSTIDKKNI